MAEEKSPINIGQSLSSEKNHALGDKGIIVPKAMTDNYAERASAALNRGKETSDPKSKTGSWNPGSEKKETDGSSKKDSDKTTSQNYTDKYRQQQEEHRQQQEALKKSAQLAREEQEKTVEKTRQIDKDTRMKLLGSQIDALNRSFGQVDAETDNRTRAVITQLARELAALKGDKT